MEHHTFRHLSREWEATIIDAADDRCPVRFRDADATDPETYEARVDREELKREEDARDLALRRGLESALVLNALAGEEDGLTPEEIAHRTGMPVEAAADRIEVLESVQPVPDPDGASRYYIPRV
ncbi:MAG: hypothetical protein ACOC3J_02555 [Gemmatimonadota bacterium]